MSSRSQVICLGGVFLSCYLIFNVKKPICIFFLSLAFRFLPKGLSNFIFNRCEICPILLILAYLISFSSSQVSHFNRFLFIFISPVPFLKLLPLTSKPTLLYSVSLCCWGWGSANYTNSQMLVHQALPIGVTRGAGGGRWDLLLPVCFLLPGASPQQVLSL